MNSPTCIWNNIPASPDEYVEFIDSFNYASGRVELSITADSQYAVYLGGKLAAFGQYSDYPYDKVYDTVDITEFCAKGENNLKIIVWYFGENSSTYFVGDALLAYEIKCNGKILTQSSENTLSRLSPCYLQHNCRLVTNQMGFGFSYDVRGEENNEGFSPGVIVKEDISLRPRPNKKLVLKSTVSAKEIKKLSDTEVLFDLGEEYCGFLELSVTSDEEQELTVSFGEHIADGRVRRLVGGRDFSHSVYLKKGENRYMNPFRRLACR